MRAHTKMCTWVSPLYVCHGMFVTRGRFKMPWSSFESDRAFHRSWSEESGRHLTLLALGLIGLSVRLWDDSVPELAVLNFASQELLDVELEGSPALKSKAWRTGELGVMSRAQDLAKKP